MMDNLELLPEEFYSGYTRIRSTVDYINDISSRLNSIKYEAEELNIDLTDIISKTNRIETNLTETLLMIERIKNIMINIDSNIAYLFEQKELDNILNGFEYFEEDTLESDLDKLKNKNDNTGADKTLNGSSVLDVLRNKNGINSILDKIKTLNGNTGGEKSLNTNSMLDSLKTNQGVNLVLDTLKNQNNNTGSDLSLDVTSILNKEM